MKSNDHLSVHFGPLDNVGVSYLDRFGEVLSQYLPAKVIAAHGPDQIINMASEFTFSPIEMKSLVCFVVPGYQAFYVPLDEIPSQIITRISLFAADPLGIGAEWFKGYLSGDATTAPTDVKQLPTMLGISPRPVSLYPRAIIKHLRKVCAIQLKDGEIVTDVPVYTSVLDGHRVLCGFKDTYPFASIRGFATLPEPYASRETRRNNFPDRHRMMKPTYELFQPLRGKTVLAYLLSRPECEAQVYGYVEPQAGPVGVFEIGRRECSYSSVVFMAKVDEIDALIQLEKKASL